MPMEKVSAIIFILNGIAMKRRLFIFFFIPFFSNTIFIRVCTEARPKHIHHARLQCKRGIGDFYALWPIQIVRRYYTHVLNWTISCVYIFLCVVGHNRWMLPFISLPFSYTIQTENVNWDDYIIHKRYYYFIFFHSYRFSSHKFGRWILLRLIELRLVDDGHFQYAF